MRMSDQHPEAPAPTPARWSVQSFVVWGVAVTAPALALLALLANVASARPMISPAVTHVGTLTVIPVTVAALIFFRFGRIRWTTHGQAVRARLRPRTVVAMAVPVLGVLWLPRFWDRPEQLLELGLTSRPGQTLSRSNTHPVEDGSVERVLTVKNVGDEAVQSVAILLQFPEAIVEGSVAIEAPVATQTSMKPVFAKPIVTGHVEAIGSDSGLQSEYAIEVGQLLPTEVAQFKFRSVAGAGAVRVLASPVAGPTRNFARASYLMAVNGAPSRRQVVSQIVTAESRALKMTVPRVYDCSDPVRVRQVTTQPTHYGEPARGITVALSVLEEDDPACPTLRGPIAGAIIQTPPKFVRGDAVEFGVETSSGQPPASVTRARESLPSPNAPSGGAGGTVDIDGPIRAGNGGGDVSVSGGSGGSGAPGGAVSIKGDIRSGDAVGDRAGGNVTITGGRGGDGPTPPAATQH